MHRSLIIASTSMHRKRCSMLRLSISSSSEYAACLYDTSYGHVDLEDGQVCILLHCGSEVCLFDFSRFDCNRSEALVQVVSDQD